MAAEALRTRDWQGIVVRELLGPRDLTFAEVTRILGTRLGKPDLPYVRMTYEDLTATFVQTGFSADVARTYVQLVRALSEGTVEIGRRTNGGQHDTDALRGVRRGIGRGVRERVSVQPRVARSTSRISSSSAAANLLASSEPTRKRCPSSNWTSTPSSPETFQSQPEGVSRIPHP